jgi:copper resistance protein C
MMRRRLAILTLLAAVPLMAGAAAMHLKLVRSDPVANSTVATSPTRITLWFSQRPEVAVSSVQLRSGSGTTAVERALAPLTRATMAGSPIVAPVGAALVPGQYEIVWRTMARDGHVLNGVIPFTVGGATPSR